MNSAKKDGLFFLLFLLLVGGLAYGQYFYINEMKGLKTEIRELKTRSMKLDQQAKEQMKQIDVYKKAIAQLEKYQLGIPENEVDFYAWVQQELTKNGVKSNATMGIFTNPHTGVSQHRTNRWGISSRMARPAG